MSDNFAVAFLFFFVNDLALQYVHDKFIDAYVFFYQNHISVIGFTSFAEFKVCEEFCLNSRFKYISYVIQIVHM